MSKHKKQEERDVQDQTLIINVNLTRGTVALLALATVVFLGYVVWGGQGVAAAGGQASPDDFGRQFNSFTSTNRIP